MQVELKCYQKHPNNIGDSSGDGGTEVMGRFGEMLVCTTEDKERRWRQLDIKTKIIDRYFHLDSNMKNAENTFTRHPST